MHKLRNLAAVLPRQYQRACLAEAKTIYAAPHARAASRRFRQWIDTWRPVAPKAVLCLAQDSEELLAFFACPPADWRTVRTTNAIERSFREVRRRTRPMSCFQNNRSCDRIVYAVISHLNERGGSARPSESTQNT